MTLRQTCPPKRSCGSGSKEERTHSQLPRHHQSNKAVPHRERTSETRPKSRQRTATRNRMQAKHRSDTWDLAVMPKLPRMLIIPLPITIWAHQTLLMGEIHRTQQRVTVRHHLTGTATGQQRTRSRLGRQVQGDCYQNLHFTLAYIGVHPSSISPQRQKFVSGGDTILMS